MNEWNLRYADADEDDDLLNLQQSVDNLSQAIPDDVASRMRVEDYEAELWRARDIIEWAIAEIEGRHGEVVR